MPLPSKQVLQFTFQVSLKKYEKIQLCHISHQNFLVNACITKSVKVTSTICYIRPHVTLSGTNVERATCEDWSFLFTKECSEQWSNLQHSDRLRAASRQGRQAGSRLLGYVIGMPWLSFLHQMWQLYPLCKIV